MPAALKEGPRMTPQFNSEDREIFVEAEDADALKTFLAEAGIRIQSDCRDVEAVLRLSRDADLIHVGETRARWNGLTPPARLNDPYRIAFPRFILKEPPRRLTS